MAAEIIQFNPSLDFNDAAPMAADSLIDAEAVARHMDLLFGACEADEWIALRSFPERPGAKGQNILEWIRNDASAAQKAHAFAVAADERGYSCFVLPGTVAGQGKASAEDVSLLTTVLVDIDAGDIATKLNHLVRYLGRPSMVIESGGRVDDGQAKIHAYWKLNEPVSGDDIALVGRLRHLLAQKVGADPSFQRVTQIIRLAGSVHGKHGVLTPVAIRDESDMEYDLAELAEMIHDMPHLVGIAAPAQSDTFSLDFNAAPGEGPRAESTMLQTVREGGQDGITRFDALSQTIGYWLRRHHDGMIPFERAWQEIQDYNTACVRPSWPLDRLQQEVSALWKKHVEDNGQAKPYVPPAAKAARLTSFSLRELLGDHAPMPDDLVSPRVLPPGGLLVLGGAPKVGTSLWMLHFLIHLAAGIPWLGMAPPRPLRIFYEQAEIEYDYLRERIREVNLPSNLMQKAFDNLVITPRFKGILNEEGVAASIDEIKRRFSGETLDIIAIDPIRNVFDGGPDGAGENDAAAMLYFLSDRVEAIRDAVAPKAGIILAHHTKKMKKKDLEEDPMQALAGSGALRGYYTTGIVMWKPDETKDERMMHFELRNANGKGLGRKIIALEQGRFIECDQSAVRIAGTTQQAKWKQEADRQTRAICEAIYNDAKDNSVVYTMESFAQTYANIIGLGSASAITNRIKELTMKGFIKYFDGKNLGKVKPNKSPGFLCVEGMVWGGSAQDDYDADTGECNGVHYEPILPTHYKSTDSLILPVEDPRIWVYPESAPRIH